MAEQFANVDTVYQTVLALANKEQRGYITPQEFNLFARQAQMEIFEQYFYDLDQIKRGVRTTSSDFSNNLKQILEDKLAKFISSEYLSDSGSGYTLPSDNYKGSNVSLHIKGKMYPVEKVNRADASKIIGGGYLTKPNFRRAVYYTTGKNALFVSPNPSTDSSVISYGDYGAETPSSVVFYSYFRKPKDPNWTYLVVNEKAIWAPNTSTRHFELDKSEERTLILKILQYAGVSIKELTLTQVAGQADANTTAQQKQ